MKVVASGTGPGLETWAWSLSLVQPGLAGPGDYFEAVPAALVGAIKEFHWSTFISSQARLTTIKANLIGVDGKYLTSENPVEVNVPGPGGTGEPGGGTTNVFLDNSLAVTLRTDARRGLASRGRFYPPYVIASADSDGRVTTSVSTAVANAAATMINAINAIPGSNLRVGVVSNVRGGASRRVTAIEVGRVMDHVSRRRRQLNEAYVPGPTINA